jgi:thiamine-phosphate pyrophosphorylase
MKAYAIAQLESPPGEEFFDRIVELVRLRVEFLQLRGPSLTGRSMADAAARCRELTAGTGTKFLVSRRADIAAAVGADGVHLPAAGLPVEAVRRVDRRLLAGRSCHSVDDCAAARSEGADYVLLGPVFPPRSKGGQSRITPDDLRAASALGVPVFALGGISASHFGSFMGTGIEGVAAITMFMQDRPLEPVLEELRKL